MALYVFVGIAVIAVLATVGYFVARFLKGSLKLTVSGGNFRSTEVIGGKILLLAKQPIQGFVQVSLVGRERRTTRSSSGGRRSRWVEVYRYDWVVEEMREFRAGSSHNYDYELLAPTEAQARKAYESLSRMAADADGLMGVALKGLATLASSHHIHWHVEARVDAEGVDLYTKQKVNIQLD